MLQALEKPSRKRVSSVLYCGDWTPHGQQKQCDVQYKQLPEIMHICYERFNKHQNSSRIRELDTHENFFVAEHEKSKT